MSANRLCVRIGYSDKTSNFSELLEKESSLSLSSLPKYPTVLSKGVYPEILKELFQFRNGIPYNLR